MRYPVRLAAALMLLVLPVTLRAEFMMPEPAPVTRLVQNAEAYVQEHPEEAKGWYVLARVHYLAFVNQSLTVPVYARGAADKSGLPEVAADWAIGNAADAARGAEAQRRALAELGAETFAALPEGKRQAYYDLMGKIWRQLATDKWLPPGPPPAELSAHAQAADTAFAKCLALAPKDALALLGRASLWHQAQQWAAAAQVATPLPGATPMTTADLFYQAYQAGIAADLKLERQPLQGIESLVGYEAATRYLALTAATPDTEPVKARRAEVSEGQAKLNKLPRGGITPVICAPDRPAAALAELLAPPARTVPFDFYGCGTPLACPWVQPGTALLVWDPTGSGQITSGRQLFGSVTWWLFFPDGYRALDLLDDNRDGELSGAELAGIRVWCDRNGNAVAEPGEVSDLASYGIAGIATRPDSKEDGALRASLRFTDGHRQPTWDWCFTPQGVAR